MAEESKMYLCCAIDFLVAYQQQLVTLVVFFKIKFDLEVTLCSQDESQSFEIKFLPLLFNTSVSMSFDL